MSIVTIGDFKNYLQTVANAVSSGKMNVNDDEVKSVLQTIAAAVGEVSATPTANTLADRLKEIADRLGEASANPTANTALARLKALEGYLDGLEAALGTQADAEAIGNGSLIALVKRLRTILTDVWNDAANALNVQLTGSNAQVDGSTTPPIQNMLFSGTSWDRWRNNTEGTLLASASRSATTTSPKQTNYNARGVNIYLNITAIPNDAAQKLTVFVREFDPVSGLPKVLTSFEIAGNVSPRVHLFKIYPGIVETSDIGDLYTQGLNLGRTWDIQIWHTGSGAWTYSVGYSYTL